MKHIVLIVLILIFSLTIVKTPASTNANLINTDYNPSFENWVNSTTPAGHYIFPSDLNLSRSTSVVEDGQSSLHINFTATDTITLNKSYLIPAQYGAYYQLSLWLKLDSYFTARISILTFDNNSNTVRQTDSQYDVGQTNWTQLTVTAQAGFTSTLLGIAIQMFCSTSCDLYLDNLQLNYPTTTTAGTSTSSPANTGNTNAGNTYVGNTNTASNQNPNTNTNPNTIPNNSGPMMLVLVGSLIAISSAGFVASRRLKVSNQKALNSIFTDFLRTLQCCPYDNTKIQIKNKVEETTTKEFTVSRMKVHEDLQGAFNNKLLTQENIGQSEQLMIHIFNQIPINEVKLVIERCPSCGREVSIPKT